MDFEGLYSKLPDFIKYNSTFLEFSMNFAHSLRKFNSNKSQLKFHKQLLEQIIINSNIEFTGTLRNIQLLYVELLRFTDNVCKKYGIEYWLDYGTLLGAVRHGGFIPWDDDLDIGMMREDYNKLIDVFPKEISRFPYLKDNCGLTLLIENEENYFKDLTDVYSLYEEDTVLVSTRTLFLQFAFLRPYVKIDIYPRDYLVEEKKEYLEKHYRSKKYEFNTKVKQGIYPFFEKLDEYNKEFGLGYEKTSIIAPSFDMPQLDDFDIHPTTDIFPLKTITFEGYEFYAPFDCDSYLKVYFGDNYMGFPSEEYAHGMVEFIESQFNSKTEMDEFILNTIDNLKNINDNFE